MNYNELRQQVYRLKEKYKHCNNSIDPFKGNNFITDDIITVYKITNDIYLELSMGTCFMGNPIIGVTFRTNTNRMDYLDYNGCAYTIEETEEIINKLLKGIK